VRIAGTALVPFTETRVDAAALPWDRHTYAPGEKTPTYLFHLLDVQEVSRERIAKAVTTLDPE
jgi:hypothetical protein